MIRLRHVSKIYRTGDVFVPALQDIDLDIDHGEFVAIVGSSGSGKSTLMNVIGCLDRPTRGTYELEGRDVGKLNDVQLAKVRSRRIGFVFQSFNLLARLPALAQVELPLIYRGSGNRRKLAARALADVGLTGRMRHKPSQLSGGEQQRVAIARALVTNPALILADEPTGALDTKTTADVVDTFVRLNRERGITIIFVTHEPEVAAYTRRMITLRDGRVIADAPTARTTVVPFPGTVSAAEHVVDEVPAG
ncbi:MAG: ABC transporter ATP-binding protein [Chloroflexota bacterium]|nr:ABC transporter ATP-binding protein [Chloroflexota bacterium]